MPYYGLASGFLTGKYRPGQEVDSARSPRARAYLGSDRGRRVLAVLDAVSTETGASPAAVALAWLAAQPTVVAPIASARTVEQLRELLPMTGLQLSEGQPARPLAGLKAS